MYPFEVKIKFLILHKTQSYPCHFEYSNVLKIESKNKQVVSMLRKMMKEISKTNLTKSEISNLKNKYIDLKNFYLDVS